MEEDKLFVIDADNVQHYYPINFKGISDNIISFDANKYSLDEFFFQWIRSYSVGVTGWEGPKYKYLIKIETNYFTMTTKNKVSFHFSEYDYDNGTIMKVKLKM